VTVIQAAEAAEKPGGRTYAHPVVNAFYGNAIRVLEDADDGASAATGITAEFQRHHNTMAQQISALTGDVRRISADDAMKAQMLTHAARHSGRMLEENIRQAGRLHVHQDVETRMHDLAAQLDVAHPSIATQIREILSDVSRPVPLATGTVVVASQTDHRWTVGWFTREGAANSAPQVPLPFVGWILAAETPGAPAQGIESAFLSDGNWYSKAELAQRGLLLRRMD
jgi:hypothetical protein